MNGNTKMDSDLGLRVILIVTLTVGIVVTAIWVVYLGHQNRQQRHLLQTLKQEETRLQTEWGQLLLEQSTRASLGRVETIARQKLNMRQPEADQIILVKP